MVISEKEPLVGKRILVPPARPEANPLLGILERRGAEALAFPALKVEGPDDFGPMDGAIRRLEDFDCILFSGSNCVINFFERMEALQLDEETMRKQKIVAIGHGAVSALKQKGMEIYAAPKRHTADGVTAALGKMAQEATFLLVRAEGASGNLPQILRGLGAKVTEVAGYRMLVHATIEMAERAFGRGLDALALANPTAVRFFLKGADRISLDLKETLQGVTIAAVGPATAKVAGEYGLTPNIISKGHIADLAESLTALFSKV